ncbi:MAG: sensor histidine kinase [Acidimicrobiales bacterium]
MSEISVTSVALLGAWAAGGVTALTAPTTKRLGALILIGTLLGAIALAGAELSGSPGEFVSTVGSAVTMAVAAHALLALPSGRLATRSRHAVAVAIYAAAGVGGLITWIVAGRIPTDAVVLAWAAAVGATLPAAHQRYTMATGPERHRLQWLGFGAAVAAETALATVGGHLLMGWPRPIGATVAVATVAVPAAFCAGTWLPTRVRIDRMLAGAVSVVGLTAVAVGVYVVVVNGLGGGTSGDDHHVLGLSILASVVAAVAYLPLKRGIADMANRLVYGERSPPDDVLRTFGSRLTRAIPMDELLLQLAESLRKTMALTSAEVFTGAGDVMERAASVPDRGAGVVAIGERERAVVTGAGVSGTAWVAVWLPALLQGRAGMQLRVAPVTNSGELLGLIVVERPAEGDPFTAEDERVLTELARQAGLALHNMQLDSALQASLDEVRRQAEELRGSRSRIVAAADEERRRIERDLHDGAQQHLVSLAVNLRLLRGVVEHDPTDALGMVDALAADVRETIQELRDLAHGIYPPLLIDAGLREALRAAANRSPLDAAVTADGIARYRPEIEAAVYFCCLEALQNAAKHAPDARVHIRLWEEGGGLLFEVADEGPGFDPVVATQGHGYLNMSDRLGAIGGTVRWESAPGGGGRVSGALPL